MHVAEHSPLTMLTSDRGVQNALRDVWDDREKRPLPPHFVWKHDRAAYLRDHPPPPDGFTTPEWKMHAAFTAPLAGLAAQNEAAGKARGWAIRTYMLFKQLKDAREELFMAVSSGTCRLTQIHRARTEPSETANVLSLAHERMVKHLVAELRARMEEGRAYHVDFAGREGTLARMGSPFFHAVSMWTAMERFLRGFGSTSIQASLMAEDGTPHFTAHAADTRVSAPATHRTRRRQVAPVDLDSSDESVF